MLELLRISNYAIIEELEAEFPAGMVTITGETGAGKSIILGALKLALGERATSEAVRTGARRASIEAVFSDLPAEATQWLEEAGLLDEEAPGQVILRREIPASGSTRNFINSRSATAAQMRELGDMLVDLHGQNEHTSLYSAALQLRLLDSYGAHVAQLEAFRQAFASFRQTEQQLAALIRSSQDDERRKSFLEFQLEEITSASLVAGEDEQLEQERRRLQNAGRLGTACQSACDLLYEGEKTDSPASALISAAAKSLAEVASLDPSQEQLAADAESLRFTLEDLVSRIRDYAAGVAADPERLVWVDERLNTLRSLKRKYGASIPEILATAERITGELQQIENRDEEIAKTQARHEDLRHQLVATAQALTSARTKAAREFQSRVQTEMRELELAKAVFRIDFESTTADLGPEGGDRIEFVVALNPGEEARPLRKVASGGEISRIMLAIESVFAERDEIPTLVFDEVDVGISGEAAARVAEKLRGLSATHQVICITHLPQVAARGTSHLVVEKRFEGQRTQVTVRAIGGKDRTEALARMLSGRQPDEESRRYAEKLLSSSK